MSYHILSIDSPDCSLSCRDGQVTLKSQGEKEKTVPIEDVASIIITSFSALVHSHLLLEAAKHGVALIICESFKPVSLVLPANRATDTLLTRAQVELKARERELLWRKTIDAKCLNQVSLAKLLNPQHRLLTRMEGVARGKHPQKEATCAALYWQVFGDAMGRKDFSRDRDEEGINALLNYGYAVLLSTVLQKLFALGLDPTFGIGHAIRERSTPLAYDLMEPFRACVDWRVAQWVRQQPLASGAETVATAMTPTDNPHPLGVTKEFRRWVTAFPLEQVDYFDVTLEIRGVIEGMVRGFRKAVIEKKPALYRPWTQTNTRWVG
ncbi:MAG: type II CRISPR-associated endonuclease Cas1 [Prosthecobacter sp.]|nr:type II CRISPR-associated endonuclease Cas1 [Prosthecobacter sp.]